MKFYKFTDNLHLNKIKFIQTPGNWQPRCHEGVTSPPRGRKILILKSVSISLTVYPENQGTRTKNLYTITLQILKPQLPRAL